MVHVYHFQGWFLHPYPSVATSRSRQSCNTEQVASLKTLKYIFSSIISHHSGNHNISDSSFPKMFLYRPFNARAFPPLCLSEVQFSLLNRPIRSLYPADCRNCPVQIDFSFCRCQTELVSHRYVQHNSPT